MMALTLCGALLCAAPAARAAEEPIGTVVGVPMRELDAFLRVNAVPGTDERGNPLPANNATVLHVAPEFNAAIATVALTRQDTGEPATSIYFPTFGNDTMSRLYRRSNAFDDWSFPRLIGEGFTAIVTVDVLQPSTGSWTPGTTKFLLVPWANVSEILAANPARRLRVVHQQRSQIGGGDRHVALMAVDRAGLLASDGAAVQIPARHYPADLGRLIRSLNRNVTLLGDDITGSLGETTIEVR
jgi:hypothetical protein